MKQYFFLYFLVLSPLLFSQSSNQTEISNTLNISNLDNVNYLLDKNLAVLDNDYSKSNNHTLFTEPSLLSSNLDESEFSSLLLVNQLEELDRLTPFHITHNPTLERYIRVFLKDRKENLSQIMDKSSYYFPVFEEHLDKYNLPLEIKYLAIIESALKPTASSASGAKGLWQFMYRTGKEYGLEVNSYVDDRFDVIKSTEAACKYLSYLYQKFNDWDLALAAYNAGPENVKKAILRANGNTNYWKIRKYLPYETQGYLPAFYATYYIFEYADMHHLKPSSSTISFLEIDTIHIKKQLTFSKIQQNIPIEANLLKALNPQYKKEIIPFSKNKNYILTLPKNLTSIFIENEKLLYQNIENKSNFEANLNHIKITRKNSYIVQEGDNLFKIAKKHNITLIDLKKWNGLQTNYLISGQRLVITNKNPINKNDSFSPLISPSLSSDKIEIAKPSVL